MAIDVKTLSTRQRLMLLMQLTIRNWDDAIAKHGEVEGYVRSRALEENTLVAFLEGQCDPNGNPLR